MSKSENKDIKKEASEASESEEEGNFYIFYNKGKEYKFDLDELTDEELEKFEKMTEKQRMRFITNFDIRKQNIFPNSISLRGAHENQMDQKEYGKYNLLEQYKNKLREVDNLIKEMEEEEEKKGENSNYDEGEMDKVSVLDSERKNLTNYFKTKFQAITTEDVLNTKKAFDLDDVSLGMLRKYFQERINNLDMTGYRKGILEKMKKLFEGKFLLEPGLVPQGDESKDKTKQKTENDLKVISQKFDMLLSHLFQKDMKFQGDNTSPKADNERIDSFQAKKDLEDIVFDATIYLQKQFRHYIKNSSLVPIPERKELIQYLNDFNLGQLVKKLKEYKVPNKIIQSLNSFDDFLNLYQQYEEVPKIIKDEPTNYPEKYLTNPTENQISDKLPVVNNDEERPKPPAPELDKVEESEIKEEPKEEPEKRDPDTNSTAGPLLTDAEKQGIQFSYFVKNRIQKDMEGMKGNYPEKEVKNFKITNQVIPVFITYTPGGSFTFSFKIKYPSGDLVGSYANNQFKIEVPSKGTKITYHIPTGNTQLATFDKNGENGTIFKNVVGGKITYKFIDTDGVMKKIYSGSIIDKIRRKFQKAKNSTIESSEPVKELRNEISDIKSELRELKELIKSKTSAPPPLVPSVAPPVPSKPVAPQIPTKPQLRHVELEEEKKEVEEDPNSIESQLHRTMEDRRKDIEYSDSSEEDVDWGAGYSKMSAKEFIAKLKAKPSDVSTMKSGRLY